MTDPAAATTASPEGLCAFVDASPSPFHVVETTAARLRTAGYSELAEGDRWPAAGKHYVVRGGSIVAFDASVFAVDGAFRIVGGHTDSPNLRVKQHPDLEAAGLSLVGLEPYGGAWLNSWLDRDLGISGRLAFAGPDGARTALVRIDEPVLRVPQLAIHLSENRKGVELDPQRHVNAIRGVGAKGPFVDLLAEAAGVDPETVLGWELMTHDLAPSRVVGADGDLLSAPRLDNQGTCYAGVEALVAAPSTVGVTPVLALFDHEEVGSGSDRGAASDLLLTVLERIVLAAGGDREDFLRVMSRSVCASGDMAHATHPNYPDRHEPAHRIAVNGGPVLKVNQNLRYASDATGEAIFAVAAEQAGVPLQRYVHRADLPCGSTIGPITAARTGLSTVDVGAPQLAMHSARELMGSADVAMYSAALAAFLAPA
ncbi:M18 family aminopeptidase [Tsukamurella pseudospumae]|uniref:M18 family aminopeptidase n=1 Tax=Tsukamurella pseudospumae TaxID=239498 RepID=A0A138A3H9_9ACTN|nr:M18 family aminopeptidase [Tsukamurella pseudospumae]KXO98663.1 aminopeptidase [Tsukamurella pseudospumae]KXP04983.1 aminopeptidase [Tsukamurella pseudospumae]